MPAPGCFLDWLSDRTRRQRVVAGCRLCFSYIRRIFYNLCLPVLESCNELMCCYWFRAITLAISPGQFLTELVFLKRLIVLESRDLRFLIRKLRIFIEAIS